MKAYKALFMQLSYNLLAGESIRDYYRDVYSCNPGYVMPPHFMEVPTWITYASGYLDDMVWDKELLIIENVEDTIRKLNKIDRPTSVFMSVMESNRALYWRIVDETIDNPNVAFIAGGYTDLTPFDERGVVCLDEITDIANRFVHANADRPPDYSLFAGQKYIPRLSLSDGCLYNCAFCSIPRTVTEYTQQQIQDQLDGFAELEFDLIYVNDKTYGQARNWTHLRPIGRGLSKERPNFKGFIVQTTVNMALKHAVEWYENYYVRYVEVGVEIPNAEFLHKFRKPYSLDQLASMSQMFRANPQIGFIPNIIFGSPDDDYQDTLHWLVSHKDIVRFINPYILSTYEDQKGDIAGVEYNEINSQENTTERTWLDDEGKQRMEAALDWTLWWTNPVRNGDNYAPTI